MNAKLARQLPTNARVVYRGAPEVPGTVTEVGPHGARVFWDDGEAEMLPFSEFATIDPLPDAAGEGGKRRGK